VNVVVTKSILLLFLLFLYLTKYCLTTHRRFHFYPSHEKDIGFVGQFVSLADMTRIQFLLLLKENLYERLNKTNREDFFYSFKWHVHYDNDNKARSIHQYVLSTGFRYDIQNNYLIESVFAKKCSQFVTKHKGVYSGCTLKL
jgi:hypothetical protein